MTATSALKLLVVIGSTREGRFGPTVASWFMTQASADPGFDAELIDLLDHGSESAAFAGAVAQADAVVIVTPEYNHAYPGPLKAAIDNLNAEWVAKPVAFISYGGMSGGLRSVEALRPVLTELNAVPLRDVVSFHQASTLFDEQGALIDAEAADTAAAALLTSLSWWASVLRDGVAEHPFGERPLGAATLEDQ